MVYVVIGYDEDWYTFETFMGVFSTKEKAQAIVEIYPIAIDEEFKATEEIFPCEEDEE